MTQTIRSSLASTLTALAVCFGAVQVSADNISSAQSDYISQYTPLLKSVSALELPATSARLVATALQSQKEPVALAVVRVVSKVNPSALPPVVGAISRVEPSVTGKISTEATKLQPKLTSAIKSAVIITTQPTPNSPTVAPQSVPDPQPTDGAGKKRGHYKGTPEGPPGQLP